MAFLPDPRGLFLQAMLGVIFTRDFYFPFFLFAAYHYVILWANLGIGGEPVVTDQYNFMVRMWFIYFQGAAAGWIVTWTLGNPILIPIHVFDRWRPKVGAALLTISAFLVARALLIAIGRYDARFSFPSGSQTAHWVAFSIYVVLIILVFILSYAQIRKRFWRWFTITPKRSVKTTKETDGRLSTNFVVFLILLLIPQTIWDFGFVKWSFISNLNTRFGVTGAITLVVEALVWVFGWWFFRRAHNIHDPTNIHSWFSEKYSLVTWNVFILVTALFSILPGLAYLIVGLAITSGDIDDINVTITLSLIVVAIASLLIWFFKTMKIYNERKEIAPGGPVHINEKEQEEGGGYMTQENYSPVSTGLTHRKNNNSETYDYMIET